MPVRIEVSNPSGHLAATYHLDHVDQLEQAEPPARRDGGRGFLFLLPGLLETVSRKPLVVQPLFLFGCPDRRNQTFGRVRVDRGDGMPFRSRAPRIRGHVTLDMPDVPAGVKRSEYG